MTDPAMWSRAKQVATYIVRDWMLLEADKRIMSTLVEEIELELDRSFEAGMRAANHAAPLIRSDALEEAAQRIEADEEDYLVRNEVAAMIRALKLTPPSPSADSA